MLISSLAQAAKHIATMITPICYGHSEWGQQALWLVNVGCLCFLLQVSTTARVVLFSPGCVYVFVCECYHGKMQNAVLESPTIAGTTFELSGRCPYICRSEERFCHQSIPIAKDTVTKLYGCVAEIKMKAEFEDGCVAITTEYSWVGTSTCWRVLRPLWSYW